MWIHKELFVSMANTKSVVRRVVVYEVFHENIIVINEIDRIAGD